MGRSVESRRWKLQRSRIIHFVTSVTSTHKTKTNSWIKLTTTRAKLNLNPRTHLVVEVVARITGAFLKEEKLKRIRRIRSRALGFL